VILWEELDERERAVWSATVGACFLRRLHFESTDSDALLSATNLADRAVYELREQAKKGPYR
jgi:hypothetical protein